MGASRRKDPGGFVCFVVKKENAAQWGGVSNSSIRPVRLEPAAEAARHRVRREVVAQRRVIVEEDARRN